jgi:DNA-binding MarR family transcriptional regulator
MAGRSSQTGSRTGPPAAAAGPAGPVDPAAPADPGAAPAHPAAALSEIVHQRHRLGILTITSRSRQASFGYLREALSLTSGNLSTHLTVLEGAGLVRVEKGYEGRRPRTWVSITGQGRAALAAEMDALTRLVRAHEAEPDAENTGGNGERKT